MNTCYIAIVAVSMAAGFCGTAFIGVTQTRGKIAASVAAALMTTGLFPYAYGLASQRLGFVGSDLALISVFASLVVGLGVVGAAALVVLDNLRTVWLTAVLMNVRESPGGEGSISSLMGSTLQTRGHGISPDDLMQAYDKAFQLCVAQERLYQQEADAFAAREERDLARARQQFYRSLPDEARALFEARLRASAEGRTLDTPST